MDLLSREKPLFSLMGNPTDLGQALLFMESTSIPQKRQKAHWQGRVFMLQGKLHDAVSSLSMTIMLYGAHMGLRADLASCYDQLSMPHLLDKALLQIKNEYELHKKTMHPVNQVRTTLQVGKLLQKAGHLDFAAVLYRDNLSTLEKDIDSPKWILEYSDLFGEVLEQIYNFGSHYGYYEEAQRAFDLTTIAQNENLIPKRKS